MEKLLNSGLTLLFYMQLLTNIPLFSQQLQEPKSISYYDSVKVKNRNNEVLINPWAGGLNYPMFSEIDANFDKISDLYIFDKSNYQSYVFIGQINSDNKKIFKHHPYLSEKFPKIEYWGLLRDYNNDGLPDLFSRNSITYNGSIVYKNISKNNEIAFELDPNIKKKGILTKYSNFTAPLFISHIDLPAIDDIDNDGDLDILSFGLGSGAVTYYKNLSMEKYNIADSISNVFEIRNDCWGGFYEHPITSKILLNYSCGQTYPNPESKGNLRHSGSTITSIDIDNSGSKDLLIGDVSYELLTLLINGDVSKNKTSSNIISTDTLFPKNNGALNRLELTYFPGAYNINVDNNNQKDLIVTPFCQYGCENTKGIYYYKNTSQTNIPKYQLIEKNFLQNQMIDMGEFAHPRFIDFNNDNLLDIIIGSHGFFDTLKDNRYRVALYLLQNIGTSNNPEFKLVDTNYASITQAQLDFKYHKDGRLTTTYGICPTFGDVDQDGDVDMIIGDFRGYLHYYENVSSSPNTMKLELKQRGMQNINVGNNATPRLFDIDGDNKLDLIIGNYSGTFAYFKNTSTTGNVFFSEITKNFGHINTKTFYYNNGISNPFIFKNNNEIVMYSGSNEGGVFKFGEINSSFNVNDTFKIIDSNYFQKKYQGSSIDMADINNDKVLDVLVGTKTGGIILFKGSEKKSISELKKYTNPKKYAIYPNPAKTSFTLDIPKKYFLKNTTIKITNLLGQIVFSKKLETHKENINTQIFSNGLYFIRITPAQEQATPGFVFEKRKLIIQN